MRRGSVYQLDGPYHDVPHGELIAKQVRTFYRVLVGETFAGIGGTVWNSFVWEREKITDARRVWSAVQKTGWRNAAHRYTDYRREVGMPCNLRTGQTYLSRVTATVMIKADRCEYFDVQDITEGVQL